MLVFTMAFTAPDTQAAIDFNKEYLETEHVAGNVSMIISDRVQELILQGKNADNVLQGTESAITLLF
jgi:hypothetical protein